MADIRSRIQDQYHIDIDEENILKIYKIDGTPNLSGRELEKKIAEGSDHWDQLANSPNEKIAQKGKLRQARRTAYEDILRNPGLRKELYAYYGNGSGGGSSSSSSKGETFAREYLRLVGTTKTLTNADLNFFLDYYSEDPEIRRSGKAIREMARKEFGLTADTETDGRSGQGAAAASVPGNGFKESTILNLRKCEKFYGEVQSSPEIRAKVDGTQKSLYEFLTLDRTTERRAFADLMESCKKKAYSLKRDWGKKFEPLVSLYNTMADIISGEDVQNRFPQFRMLVRYPELTPYMFSFKEMKPETLDGLLEAAKKAGYFHSRKELVQSYYNPMYSSFGISNTRIRSLLQDVQRETDSAPGRRSSSERSGAGRGTASNSGAARSTSGAARSTSGTGGSRTGSSTASGLPRSTSGTGGSRTGSSTASGAARSTSGTGGNRTGASASATTHSQERESEWNGEEAAQARLPFPGRVLFVLAHWPVYLEHLIFRIVKMIVGVLPHLSIPVFLVLFLLMNTVFSDWAGMENLSVLLKLFNGENWSAFLNETIGTTGSGWFERGALSLIVILLFLAVYLLPPLFGAGLFKSAADELAVRIDLSADEKKSADMFSRLRRKAGQKFQSDRAACCREYILRALVNILCAAALAAACRFLAVRLTAALETARNTQTAETAAASTAEEEEAEADETEEGAQEDAAEGEEEGTDTGDTAALEDGELISSAIDPETLTVMVITVKSANIRSGPGTENDVVGKGLSGETFYATGSEETVSGSVWYEIYLDDELTQTGWVNELVAEAQGTGD